MTTTLLDQRAAFLRAICEEPGEDAHRLVYADFLEEDGEADMAEFVRVQCELAKLAPKNDNGFRAPAWRSNPARAKALQVREKQLLHPARPDGSRAKTYGMTDRRNPFVSRLLADFPDEFDVVTLHKPCVAPYPDAALERGFVDAVAMSADCFTRCAEALFVAAPVTAVELHACQPRPVLGKSRKVVGWVWQADELPAPVYMVYRRLTQEARVTRNHRDIHDAYLWLSHALVTCGRDLAGLSPLPVPVVLVA